MYIIIIIVASLFLKFLVLEIKCELQTFNGEIVALFLKVLMLEIKQELQISDRENVICQQLKYDVFST